MRPAHPQGALHGCRVTRLDLVPPGERTVRGTAPRDVGALASSMRWPHRSQVMTGKVLPFRVKTRVRGVWPLL